MEKSVITVSATVHAPVQQVWDYFTLPEHIVQWNNASDDWHTPSAENDLRIGGKFVSRMAAKDGSASFDFGGVYDDVIPQKKIAYTLGDDRKVIIEFIDEGAVTRLNESFEAENTHSEEMQKTGWQSILDNFKRYTEKNKQ